MQSVVVNITGITYQVDVGFEVLAYCVSQNTKGKLHLDGSPVYPGEFVVGLLTVCIPSNGHFPIDWNAYAETANAQQVAEMLAAQDIILAAMGKEYAVEPEVPAEQVPNTNVGMGYQPTETLGVDEIGSDAWNARRGTIRID